MAAKLPLMGKHFLVTRPQAQAADFVSLIEQQGGATTCIPTIEIVPPESWGALDFAMRDLDEFDIVILTSVNGVSAFFERLLENNQYIGILTQIQVVAVGPKTAKALADNHIKANLIPDDHRAEGIVAALLEQGVEGKRILYPRAEIARSLITDSLTAAGAEVVAPVAYRTIMPADSSAQLHRALGSGDIDAICFSSASTFNNLISMLADDKHQLLQGHKLFSIGPETSAALTKAGFSADLEPESWTLDALVTAMVDYYSE